MSRRTHLRRGLYRLRRFAQSAWTALAVTGFAILVPCGAFADLGVPSGAGTALLRLLAALGLGVLVVGKLASYLAAGGARHPAARISRVEGALLSGPESGADLKADLELGAILLVAAFAVVQATGGAVSPIYPLIYALVAFLVTFHRLAVGVPLIGFALLLELALYRTHGDVASARGLLVAHALFIGFFAFTHALFLQAELLRQRRAHRAHLAAEVTRMREEARDFRLISSQLGADSRTRPRAEEEEKIAQGAVETIHQALYYNLDLLKKSLHLHTCILLWLDDTGERLRVKELVTDSDCIGESSFAASAGAAGTVLKNRVAVHLEEPKRGHLPYYAGEVAIAEVLMVPVLEDGHLRGILCADRTPAAAGDRRKRSFGASDEALLANAARQILRVIQSERIFTAVERSKYEHERFYHASELLNRALTPDQVFATAFTAAREICDFDFAAVTLFDKETKRHGVVAAFGECAGAITGESFTDNAGLVAMVVKNRHYLPAGGELRDKETPVFTKKIKLKGMESLLVLPLICADEAIGSFTLASERAHFFTKDKREMLGVIANQVSVSAKNAEMYRAMEEMATTDGLTGLVNHRTFQERTADLLLRADRQGGRLALLLTDVDHFKKVNDSYGHPTGDQVLKRVAAVCKAQVRKIDIAARYGGEEFAIVLDGTDLAGAKLLAERIRVEVERQQFSSDKGLFKCTLSLGIAAFPEDGRDAKTLIHHADQSLYEAKHGGRNRAVAWADLQSGLKRLRAVQ